LETADLVKREDGRIRVVVGGPHPSALKEDLLKRCRSIDALVYGEGEATFPELVKALVEGRDLERIKGVCYRDEDQIAINEPRDPISDLDSLPRPALDLVAPIGRYPGPYPTGARPSIHIMASRGCPFNCTFCSNPVWSKKVRFRSAESVLSEVEWLRKNFKVREVFFQDDTFNVNRDWFESICHGIIERGLNEKIIFKSPFRANERLLDLYMLRLAKRAGFWMIFYGVESGNQEILNSINKNLKLEEIERAFKLTRKAGIKTYASFMIGNLGESRGTVLDTIEFAKKIDPDYYGFAIATPYPGSELYAEAVRRSYLVPGLEDYALDRYMMKTGSFAPGEVEELAKYAHRSVEEYKRSRIYRLRRLLADGFSSSHWRKKDYIPAARPPDEEILDEEIVMGQNDWNLEGGWYPVENWPPKVRWTSKRATAYLKGKIDSVFLCIRATTGMDGINFSVSINNKVRGNFKLIRNEWSEIEVPLNAQNRNCSLKVDIEVNRTWVPNRLLKNGDERELGIAVERIWVQSMRYVN
jgi:radical SAM superfamily enzyme YgiQ (UPF0313 family)